MKRGSSAPRPVGPGADEPEPRRGGQPPKRRSPRGQGKYGPSGRDVSTRSVRRIVGWRRAGRSGPARAAGRSQDDVGRPCRRGARCRRDAADRVAPDGLRAGPGQGVVDVREAPSWVGVGDAVAVARGGRRSGGALEVRPARSGAEGPPSGTLAVRREEGDDMARRPVTPHHTGDDAARRARVADGGTARAGRGRLGASVGRDVRPGPDRRWGNRPRDARLTEHGPARGGGGGAVRDLSPCGPRAGRAAAPRPDEELRIPTAMDGMAVPPWGRHVPWPAAVNRSVRRRAGASTRRRTPRSPSRCVTWSAAPHGCRTAPAPPTEPSPIPGGASPER